MLGDAAPQAIHVCQSLDHVRAIRNPAAEFTGRQEDSGKTCLFQK